MDYSTTSMDPAATAGSTIGGIIGYVILVIVLWRIFTKAGRPGWLAIIPIVNTVVLIQIAGHSGWTILFYLIPVFNIVWGIIIALHLGQSFKKGGAFSFFLLWLLSLIGYIVLAFDSSTYTPRKPAVTA